MVVDPTCGGGFRTEDHPVTVSSSLVHLETPRPLRQVLPSVTRPPTYAGRRTPVLLRPWGCRGPHHRPVTPNVRLSSHSSRPLKSTPVCVERSRNVTGVPELLPRFYLTYTSTQMKDKRIVSVWTNISSPVCYYINYFRPVTFRHPSTLLTPFDL